LRTINGDKTVYDIQKEDKLETVDGFSNLDKNYIEDDIFLLKFDDGREICLGGQHELNVINNRNNRPRSPISVSNLKNDLTNPSNVGRMGIKLYTPKSNDNNDEISLSIDPYFLGALIGDGYFGRRISLSSMDDEILLRCNSALMGGYGFVHRNKCEYVISRLYDNRQRNGRYYKGSYDNFYHEAIENYGLSHTRSNSKFIPNIYKLASTKNRIELLKGLFDTDGTINTNGGISFCTVSDQLAKDVQYLVWSLGGKCKIGTSKKYYTYKGEKRQGQIAHVLSVRHPTQSMFFYLSRKLERCNDNHQYSPNMKLMISSISYLGKGQTISFNSISNYITDNFIVV